MQAAELTIEAPAKINLHLAVKGCRPDGYHELVSYMQKLELADILRIRLKDKGISLACSDPGLPDGEENIVWKACRLFLDETGCRQGVEVFLEKNIPVAAGLGGGSSDAASLLLGLDRLLKTGLKEKRLSAMAVTLGADVPFFINPTAAALATGIGDILTPCPGIEGCWVVLVNPGFPVSTKWVYDNLALTSSGNPYILAPEKDCPASKKSSSEDNFFRPENMALFHNDLEEVTINRYPKISLIKEQLLDNGAELALMSGSGPTVFGVFRNRQMAVAGYENFREVYGETVFLTSARQI